MEIENSLNYSPYKIKGLYIITPDIYEDERGFFFESWNMEKFNSIVQENINFYQDNHSLSSKGVLRGLHYQIKPFDQGKLVRCIKCEIYDIAVDIRINSSIFAKWCGVYLNEKNKKQLWIPSGFAHGFFTTTDVAEVLYKTTQIWSKEHEKSIIWNDQTINIKWPINESKIKMPLVNEKDSKAKTLSEVIEKGEIFK